MLVFTMFFTALAGIVSAVVGIFVSIGMRILVMTVSGILILFFFIWMAGRAVG